MPQGDEIGGARQAEVVQPCDATDPFVT